MAGKKKGSYAFRKRSVRTISGIKRPKKAMGIRPLRFKKKIIPPKVTAETVLRKIFEKILPKPQKKKGISFADIRGRKDIKPLPMSEKEEDELREAISKGLYVRKIGRWLGPETRLPFGSEGKWEFTITPVGINYLRALRKRDPMACEQLIGRIAVEMKVMRAKMEYYARKLMRYVPEDTGTLRASLMWGIERGAQEPIFETIPERLNLLIPFGTPLPYLQYVNQCKKHPSTGRPIRIAHFGFPISRRTGKPLNDPDAKKHFLGLLNMNLNNYMAKCVKEFRRQLYYDFFRYLGISYPKARSFFKIKIPGKLGRGI